MRLLASVAWIAVSAYADPRVLTVAADGSGDFTTVPAAVEAAPETGAVIRIRPGTYLGPIKIGKAHIRLRGEGADPKQVVLSGDLSAGTAGGTGNSATVTVTGDDFYAENLTFENTFSRTRPFAFDLAGTFRQDPAMREIEVELTGDVDVTIDADADQLRLVFMNLLINAGQAVGGRGRISVTIERAPGDACAISVSDRGHHGQEGEQHQRPHGSGRQLPAHHGGQPVEVAGEGSGVRSIRNSRLVREL